MLFPSSMPPRSRLLFALTLAASAACAMREPPAADVDSRVALARRGEQVFKENCNVCHPGGRQGLGPAIERSIERESLVTQIRKGFGLMPAFPEDKLTDDDVSAVIAYVDGLVLIAEAEKARLAREALEKQKSETAEDVLLMVDALEGVQEPPPETIDSTSQLY